LTPDFDGTAERAETKQWCRDFLPEDLFGLRRGGGVSQLVKLIQLAGNFEDFDLLFLLRPIIGARRRFSSRAGLSNKNGKTRNFGADTSQPLNVNGHLKEHFRS
jgi:hypothetical protein